MARPVITKSTKIPKSTRRACLYRFLTETKPIMPNRPRRNGRPKYTARPRTLRPISSGIAACVVGGVSFTGGIGKISGVVVGVLIFTALTYSLTILGIDTNLQFVFEGIIILTAVTLDCLKYVQKK